MRTVLGRNACVALTGERVDAVVSQEIDAQRRRIADPASGEDLGELPGVRSVIGRADLGDVVAVAVVRDSDLAPVPADRAATATTAAQV